jgi:lysyl-tRNA synthetase, class I
MGTKEDTGRKKEEKGKKETAEDGMGSVMHWADRVAENVIREKGDKKNYTIAAGITPSGVVHIGNFREIITVELVKRALESKGKKVRFIYSWDDYDRLRKVPVDMPKQAELKKYIGKPIVLVPDTYGCHKSYAEHHEKAVEDSLPAVDIAPEFLYQSKKYKRCEYAEEMKHALEHTKEIVSVLNTYREEPLAKDWLPVSIFCEKCNMDTVAGVTYSGGYELSYTCSCGGGQTFDFRKKGIAKLKWRVDWPMRWAFEKVDFEPGGKDHSTTGGSFDTGKQICKDLWNFDAPTYAMYNFVSIKGGGGKMSSSKGGVVTLSDVLEVYEPEMVRWFFSGTRPNAEFAFSFDGDVIKYYEDFDKCEQIYFGLHDVKEKEKEKQRRIYELSYVGKIPKHAPFQPSFRHLTTIVQIHELNVDKTVGFFSKELKNEHDRKRLLLRATCAKNWLEKHAPEEFTFAVQLKVPRGLSLDEKQKKALWDVAAALLKKEWTDVDLHNEFYAICSNHDVGVKEFFTAAYGVLIDKEKGPRLASFILEIGRERVAELFEKV